MTTEQIKAAMKLIQLMESDEAAQASAIAYGNWYDHLTDHIADLITEEA